MELCVRENCYGHKRYMYMYSMACIPEPETVVVAVKAVLGELKACTSPYSDTATILIM